MKKTSTLALIVTHKGDETRHIDTLLEESEIRLLEQAIETGDDDPLSQIYQLRERLLKQEADFGNYVEDLLSRPFINPSIQEQGVRWLKSKIRIEHFQKTEREAAKIIADYAYRIFQEDPEKVDFLLAGPNHQVRIRIFCVGTAPLRF